MLRKRCRRQKIIFVLLLLSSGYIILYSWFLSSPPEKMIFIRRNPIIKQIEDRLEEQLKVDKGTGCEMPHLDPFNAEVTPFDEVLPKLNCSGLDWVNCYHSKCRVVREILDTTKSVICTYRDIIYDTDNEYHFGTPVVVHDADEYELTYSDFVSVKCVGRSIRNSFYDLFLPSKWSGFAAGLRSSSKPLTPPPGRENTYNVLIFGFDSTSHNRFIRRMPNSYKVLTEELGASMLKGYNIVGDGTPAALFPLLTGKTELELPDVRKNMNNNKCLDESFFIFHKLKKDGYRTAYFEDMPWIGTFQYRFNGFCRQPSDHYLRSLLMEQSNQGMRFWTTPGPSKYCMGDKPMYKFMMNLTEQFLRLDGKHFAFTFVVDITHDNLNMLQTSDDDFVDFLRAFKNEGRMEDTLLIVMGDHGPRFAKIRETFQGRLEERLPLMAIVLPEQLKTQRPGVQIALEANVDALTTPHDIHATILDALDMKELWNPYKIKGADLTRGLTLLEPIPVTRSCSEAAIEPHWCACLAWMNVSIDEPIYRKAAEALVGYINSLTQPVRSSCVPRTLTSISWVMRQRANSGLLSFVEAKDVDSYVGKFGKDVRVPKETYQAKITVGPGASVFEATMLYFVKYGRFEIDMRDISRTNAYNDEPACISATYPHLNYYCYCRQRLTIPTTAVITV